MPSLNENDIENLAIELLQKQGYSYIYGPDIAPAGGNAERESYAQVLLLGRLRAAIGRVNPDIPREAQEAALQKVQRIASEDLLANNEEFHNLLCYGVQVSFVVDGSERGGTVSLVDFVQPLNNDFVVANQFTVSENNSSRRADIVLFVNGIALVVMELKNPTADGTVIKSAYQQLQTYKNDIPSLFTYNALLVVSDGFCAKVGSLSAGFNRFVAWKTAGGKTQASATVGQLETLLAGMLNKATLLDLLRYFVVFEKCQTKDANGLTSIQTEKKIAAYHQYYAVNAAVASTLRAADIGNPLPPAEHNLQNSAAQKGDRKAGVVWHTQGSGKSLSMLFYCGKMVLQLGNPTLVIITDRNDLDEQLFDTFASCQKLLRQQPQQAKDCRHLKRLLQVAAGGVIFTTVQKFQPENGNTYGVLSQRRNIVVLADEAHRTQYGFAAKMLDTRDASGAVIGNKITYGFAKYMRDALPCATYLGFTGTPIESGDVNTPAVFGNYVDIYDIARSVEDGATVSIYYESRLAKIGIGDEGKELISKLDEDLEQSGISNEEKSKGKWTKMEALVGSGERLKNVAKDIVQHFEQRQEVFIGKAMIVCMSRRIAVALYDEIINIKPRWHTNSLQDGVIKVVISSSASDQAKIIKHHTSKQDRKLLANRIKDENNNLKIVIVCDMWLTGFDVPCLHTMYIDKPMKGHNLMQTIARVNRVYKDKPSGLVVDYLGIASDLQKALAFYSESGGKGAPCEMQESAIEWMLEKLEVVSQMYDGTGDIAPFPYRDYFLADTRQKLSLILAAEEYILGLDDGKKRYMDEVLALSKAFAIAIPSAQAMAAKDEVAFFQAVKSRLLKFDNNDGNESFAQITTTIRQVIDQALVSAPVVDIFDAAGIKKPNIAILSDEFLSELQNYKHKNIAIEVLKKLLGDELKARMKINIVQSRTLQEMLADAINKYHNKILTAAEVIDELIKISKDITASDEEAKAMDMSDFEYAFYTAVASNDSARELMQQDKLRELAVALTQKIRANATLDWQIKESVRAKLKVVVKRLLRKYGYPPDMEQLATDAVLQQAEIIANELSL